MKTSGNTVLITGGATGGVMSAEAVARGVLQALARDTYEVALGAAAHLRRSRERLFGAINGEP